MALELTFEDGKTGHPDMFVRWCITPDDFAKIQNSAVAADKVVVFIIAVHVETGQEYRTVAPFKNLMTRLVFHRPGAHHVFARIVWTAGQWDEAFKEMMSWLMSKTRHDQYRHEFLDHTKTAFLDETAAKWGEWKTVDPFESEVVVAREFFGEEPPDWLKHWVDGAFRFRSEDPCQFRRRLLAWGIPKFLLTPIWVPFVVLFNAFMVFLSKGIAGLRGNPWRTLKSLRLHEADEYFTSMPNGDISSFYLTNAQGNFSLKWMLVHPLSLMAYWLIYLNHGGIRVPNSTFMTVVTAICWLVVVLIPTLIITVKSEDPKDGRIPLLFVILEWIFDRVPHLWSEFKEESRSNRRQQDFQDLKKLVACESIRQPSAVSIGALPRKYRTVHLYFQGLKAWACRPYAR